MDDIGSPNLGPTLGFHPAGLEIWGPLVPSTIKHVFCRFPILSIIRS